MEGKHLVLSGLFGVLVKVVQVRPATWALLEV